MSKLKSGLVIVLFCMIPACFAEVVSVSVSNQAQTEKPVLGQSMNLVEKKFGLPIKKSLSVGQPPISRWRYARFTVYFEHDIVIHAVTHKS